MCKPQAYEVLNIYGFCNVVTDVLLIFMPVPLIWKMQTNRSKKIGVALVFATGSLYVLSVLRGNGTCVDIETVFAPSPSFVSTSRIRITKRTIQAGGS